MLVDLVLRKNLVQFKEFWAAVDSADRSGPTIKATASCRSIECTQFIQSSGGVLTGDDQRLSEVVSALIAERNQKRYVRGCHSTTTQFARKNGVSASQPMCISLAWPALSSTCYNKQYTNIKNCTFIKLKPSWVVFVLLCVCGYEWVCVCVHCTACFPDIFMFSIRKSLKYFWERILLLLSFRCVEQLLFLAQFSFVWALSSLCCPCMSKQGASLTWIGCEGRFSARSGQILILYRNFVKLSMNRKLLKLSFTGIPKRKGDPRKLPKVTLLQFDGKHWRRANFMEHSATISVW